VNEQQISRLIYYSYLLLILVFRNPYFIHSFILETYIAPLQEALPAQSRTKKKNFREMVEEQSKSDARVERRH